MTNGGSTGETISLSPEALINDGLRNLDNVLPHFQRQDTSEGVAQARTAEDDQTDGFTVREDTHAVSAIERARSFYRSNRRKVGAIAAMGVASLVPASVAQAEMYYPETDPFASLARSGEVALAGDDTYSHAKAPQGSKDEAGYTIGECASYARDMVIKNGTNPDRAVITYELDWYRKNGELVNSTPAAGAVGIANAEKGRGSHAVYVEAYGVDENGNPKPGNVILSEYNGHRRGAYYRWSVDESIANSTYSYVHLQLSARNKSSNNSESSPLSEAQRVKANKIDAKTTLESNTYIQSKNKQYSVLLDKKGNLVAYDKKSGYSKVWESKTSGKGGNNVQVKKSKSSNSLVIAKGNKKVTSWNIGKATKVTIGNDGTLAGYKGNKRVWVADELAAVSRAAKQSMSKIASVRQKALGR